MAGIKNGIAKVNIGTEIRQSYEQVLRQTGNVLAAQNATRQRTAEFLLNAALLEPTGNREAEFSENHKMLHTLSPALLGMLSNDAAPAPCSLLGDLGQRLAG